MVTTTPPRSGSWKALCDPARCRPVTRIRVEMVAEYFSARPGQRIHATQVVIDLLPDSMVGLHGSDVSRAVCILRSAFGWDINTAHQGYCLNRVGEDVVWPEALDDAHQMEIV